MSSAEPVTIERPLSYFPMQKLEMSASANVYWGYQVSFDHLSNF